MSKIITLGADVIPKISAGEVIERPVSVVKELIENALDAGAQNIIIEIEEAGLRKIKVIDDGEGMSKEDLLKCVLPHTTSKLKTVEDLALIKSMGFRGEALASICAVADIAIKSCEKNNQIGNQIAVIHGGTTDVTSVGMSPGTVVEVSNLFTYLPARKKFLKSLSNESQIIVSVVMAFSYAHTNTGFELYRDGKKIFKINKNDDLLLRSEKLAGVEFAQALIPIDLSTDHLHIFGFISKPQIAEQNRYSQYIFVNKRLVDDLNISKTIKDAYKSLLNARSYPPFIINIDLDWGLVDVNVHPQKERVKFWNEREVHNAIYQAVSESLAKYDLTFASTYEIDKKAAEHMYLKLKDSTPLWNLKQDYTPENYDDVVQIADTYLVYPHQNDLILVDQHAAHESILYKQLLTSFASNKLTSQVRKLAEAVFIELSPNRIPVVEENLDFFTQFGFDVELFGQSQLKVTAIPEIYQDHNLKKLLTEMVNDLAEDKTPADMDEKSRQTLAFLACRSAIKAGDKLNGDEIKRLLEKLAENPELYTCPHGRPLRIVVNNTELAKMFKRLH